MNLHLYKVPPPVADTVTVADPPLHKIEVADEDATTAVGSVIVIVVDGTSVCISHCISSSR